MVTIFCKNCLDRLRTYGMPAELIYENVCCFYCATKKPFNFTKEESDDMPYIIAVLEFLEHKGFIVTTEGEDESLFIMPIYCTIGEDEGLFFCCNVKEEKNGAY